MSPTATQYTVSEEPKPEWVQTGNTADQSMLAGGVSVAMPRLTYTVTVPNDAISAAWNLLFGNVPPPVCV